MVEGSADVRARCAVRVALRVAAVAAAAIAAVAPATANTWLAPHALATEPASPSPVAAAGSGAGLSLVGWIARPSGAVRVAERSGRGAWRVRTLAASSPAASADLGLALAASGRAVAVWNDGGSGVTYAWRSPAASWSAPAALAGAPALGAPRVAMLPDGRALVVWRDGAGGEVDGATIDARGGHSAPFTVFAPNLGLAYAGVDATAVRDDAAFVVAATSADLTTLHAGVRRVDAAGAVSDSACGATPGDLAPVDATNGLTAAFAAGPAVVADRAGGVVVALAVHSSAGSEALLARCSGTGWQQRAVPGTAARTRVALALGTGGHVLAAWTAATGIATSERLLLAAGGGTWSAPAVAASYGALRLPASPDVVLAATSDSEGTILVALVGERAGQQVFASLHRRAGRTLVVDGTDVRPASPASAALAPGIASPLAGTYVAAWRDASGNVPRTADLDVDPPRLTLTGLPATVVAGRALTLRVSGLDAFSGYVAQTARWVFGDGVRARGVRVGHRFARTGVRMVVVTALDGAGNVGRVAARVNVVAPVARLVRVRLVRGSLRVRFTAPAGARLTLAVRAARGAVIVRRLGVRARSARVAVAALPRGRYRITIAGAYGGVRVRAATWRFRLR